MGKWSTKAGTWADETIKAFPFRSLNEYSDLSRTIHNVIIDPKKIVGSNHPSYFGRTWRDFLSMGRRVAFNIAYYESNPEYYGSEPQLHENYKHWCLAKIGEEFYVLGGGNNRSLIAKYLAHEHSMDQQYMPELILINQ